ncbi:cold-shock protein [Qipengyuania seohaensis]|uniref:cold-shock protein n=1 Tax=Qipengyuania seohaensis TaxID=266951 RepID=UPI000C225BA9|nr:cold shock domain-containing protein [Qipengyuania seohaensis]
MQYGKVKSYDSSKGSGMIAPEQGGDALPFEKSDLKQQGKEPAANQRFGYETRKGDDGKECATNLQQQQNDDQSRKGQASKQQG